MRIKATVLLLCFSTLSAGHAVVAATTFADGNLTDQLWSFHSIANDRGDGYVQSSWTGSRGDLGSYREVTNYVVTSALRARTSVVGLHLNKSAVYDPSLQGGISFFVYSMDYMNHANAYQNGQAFGPALVQDGKIFLGIDGGIPPNLLRSRQHGTQAYVWQRVPPRPFGKNDFVRVDTTADNLIDLTSKPDFSDTGKPITFGFFTFNTNPPRLRTGFSSWITVGYDNWRISVHSTAPSRSLSYKQATLPSLNASGT